MTLEQLWSIYKVVTAPPSPTVARAKRAWKDLRAGAQLVNDVLPDSQPKEELATNDDA